MSTTTVNWALHLAARGWTVFPLATGTKHPAIRDWESRATTDPHRIRRCWYGAGFNIGIACGPSRLVVVDLDTPRSADGPDGAAGLTTLAGDRGVTIPSTYTVSTPTGGTHLYFRTPPGVGLRNTQGDLAPGIDTRAEGGCVAAAGSVRPDGAYELVDDTDPVELPACAGRSTAARGSAQAASG